jgi:hypothetical protein
MSLTGHVLTHAPQQTAFDHLVGAGSCIRDYRCLRDKGGARMGVDPSSHGQAA